MEKLRVPFFVAALVCMTAIVMIEFGSGMLLKQGLQTAGKIVSALPPRDSDPDGNSEVNRIHDAFESNSDALVEASGEGIPGAGIPAMAMVDGVLWFTQIIVATGLVFPKGLHARLQGCVSCVVSLMGLLSALAIGLTAFAMAMLMIALLLAVPFGTIAYFALYGFFDTTSSALILSVLLMLKIAFLVLMITAHQLYLRNMNFLLLVFSSLIANIILSLLHGLVPGFLVSITDMIGVVVMAVCGGCWMILMLIGSILASVNVLMRLVTAPVS